MKRIFFSILFLCFMFSIYANDGYAQANPITGTVVAEKTDKIQMLSEHVECFCASGTFRTEFVFLNLTNKEQVFSTIFPIVGEEIFYRMTEEKKDFDPAKYNFVSYKDGKEIESYYEKKNLPDVAEGAFHSFVTKNIHIAPRATVVIVHEYDVGPAHYYADNTADQRFTYSYIAKTGKSWAGPIEKGVFEFHIPFDAILNKPVKLGKNFGVNFIGGPESIDLSVVPKGAELIEDTPDIIVRWEFKNYEPDFNISINVDIDAVPFGHWLLPGKLTEAILEESDNAPNFLATFLGSMDCPKEEYLNFVKKWIDALNTYAYTYDDVKFACDFYINLQYAIKGYKFKDKRWLKAFSEVSWYRPITSLKPYLNSKEKKALYEVKKIRSRYE